MQKHEVEVRSLLSGGVCLCVSMWHKSWEGVNYSCFSAELENCVRKTQFVKRFLSFSLIAG